MAILVISRVRKWRPSWIPRHVIGRSLQKPSQLIPCTNEPRCRAHKNVSDTNITRLWSFYWYREGGGGHFVFYVECNDKITPINLPVDSSCRIINLGIEPKYYVSTTNTWGVIAKSIYTLPVYCRVKLKRSNWHFCSKLFFSINHHHLAL